ncbi:MAG: single-strand binding protein, single-strand DNA-binding protein [Candidatus Berkelbacteria bacterium]|nr:single-strand binding protein, single-strand DNA-binding protein [Candidatus Berkelbacteria bacterium]
MFSLNRAQIVGNVTRDPEMRYTPNGQAVCSFGVATNRRWRDKDGNNQEQTEFHNIVAWGKLAELMTQLVHKGSKIYAEGRLQTHSWEGQDGGKRNRTEIVMDDFILLTPKGAAAPAADVDLDTDTEEFPPKEVGPKPISPGLKKTETKPNTPAKIEGPLDDALGKEKSDKDTKIEDADEINLDDIPF